ncbi:MAG: UvrD-helicase domain-containing protein [Peptococcaceae bacterium]|nr:UvrD-helicase domain-containing protein [Peptococcaceae bacterium]
MFNLSDLNPAQREAVELTEGPLLLLAGAGSGKTRVLTHRVAHMIGQGVDPWSILAITFTNKAAAEMRDRINGLVGAEGKGLWVGTFHAVCMRVLRGEIGNLSGYQRGFVICDTADQLALLRAVLAELNIDDKKFAPRTFLEVIGNAKNRLLSPDTFEGEARDFFAQLAARVYRAYQEKLVANNAMDFDDIIMLTVRLFRECPQVLGFYQNRFRYILVDEYQDTNHAQYVLINLLASRFRNLCVVGDDDQSVYGWRGADVTNILEFERDYPEAAVLKLEQNYRSSGNILAVANAIVAFNQGRKEKSLWTEKDNGDPVVVHQALSDTEEARFVVDQVLRLRDGLGLNYGDFAVLYRTNAQSRMLEERFIRAGVPYRIFSGVKFYERMEIKDILAYLRFVFNPNDSVSFGRIVNTPRRGIGDASIQKVLAYGIREKVPLLEILGSLESLGQEMDLKARAVNALIGFASLIESFRAAAMSGISLYALTQLVLEESGYWDSLRANRATDGESRLENIDEFLNLTTEFDENAAAFLEDYDLEFDTGSAGAGDGDSAGADGQGMVLLGGFLERVALVADIDSYEEGEDVVKFMTIHSAKGLEFPVVFVVGMEEGIFPGSRSLLEPHLLEEERRLCYVAITRAQERLLLLHAQQRLRFGRTESAVPSRFLGEIPDALKHESGFKSGYRDRFAGSRFAGSGFEENRGLGNRERERWSGDGESRSWERDSRSWERDSRSGGKRSRDENRLGGSGGEDVLQNASPVEAESFFVGDKVIHPSFGQGIVMSCRGDGGEAEVTVVFAGEIKKLIVAYARLTKI